MSGICGKHDTGYRYKDYIESKYKGRLGYIPYMVTGTEWSMVDVFGGNPPYLPSEFNLLCPRTKWLGKCIEGNSYCTECGTLYPSVPCSHHLQCSSHISDTQYETNPPYLGGCPDCKEDSLHLSSSRELGLCNLTCSECELFLQKACCEEDFTDWYNNNYKVK